MDVDEDILGDLPVIPSDSPPDSEMRHDDLLHDVPMIPSDSVMRPYDGLPVTGSWLYDTDQPMSSYKTRSVPNFLIGNSNARLPKEFMDCSQMCKILLETYNTSIIDHFDRELKKSCMEEALKCSLKNDEIGRKRNVLAALIRNKKDIEESHYDKFDFVGGPFNITYHWSNNYKKAVYIWGEFHDKKVDFPDPKLIPNLNNTNIENFLSYYFSKPPAYSDFYIEMPGYVVENGYSYTGVTNNPDEFRINILKRTFADCVSKPATNPFCDKSRMHFFDIRQGEVKGGLNSASLFQKAIFNFVSEANSILKTHKSDTTFWDIDSSDYMQDHSIFSMKIFIFIDEWKSFFDFFARFDNDDENTQLNYKKFWYDQLRTFNIVNKEIRVMHADVRPLLNFFIKDEMDKLLSFDHKHKQTAQYSKNILTTYRYLRTRDFRKFKYGEIIELITNLDNIIDFEILDFNTLIADAYLLARVFKTFQTENYKKARLTDEPAEPHNVIIYAGNFHSQRYRTFLTYIGFRLVQHSGNLEGYYPTQSRQNCVDMRSITQPLFSFCPYYAEDNPIDTEYFKSYSLFKSFDLVFGTSFVGFTPFPQPVVPDAFLSFVSVNSTINPIPMLEKTAYGKMRSNPRSKSKRY